VTKPKIGIALGSGAARGWAHVGVLLELADNGIDPDIICGCSMGALVGAVYAAGDIDALQDWALEIDWMDVVGFVDLELGSGGLIEGKHLTEFMSAIQPDATIESLPKPFLAVATDLNTGREIWLQKGPLVRAVRASLALPGLFSPVKLAGNWLLDGGLVNPVPVSACRALGADVIIAVNLNSDLVGYYSAGQTPADPDAPPPNTADKTRFDKLFETIPTAIRNSLETLSPYRMFSKSKVPGFFDVTSSAINIMQDHITRSRLAGDPPQIMLSPRLGGIGMLELNRAKESIAEGRACVQREMPTIRTYFP